MIKEVLPLITDDILIEFRNQMMIKCNIGLETFADEGIPNFIETEVWHETFTKACQESNAAELLQYYTVYSEVCDWFISQELIHRRLILGYIDDNLDKLINIDLDNLDRCDCCRKFFPKELLKEVKYGAFLCQYCSKG